MLPAISGALIILHCASLLTIQKMTKLELKI